MNKLLVSCLVSLQTRNNQVPVTNQFILFLAQQSVKKPNSEWLFDR